MVLKRTLIRLLFLLCFISGLRAQETGVRRSQVVETYRGKQYYIHFVEQGQTLYAISQAYQVTVDDIRHANPDISEMLRDDQILMIPVKDLRATPEPVSKTETPADLPTRDVADGQRSHIVAPKETWYALARQYNLAVKDIIAANPGVDTLRIGMKVTIPEPVQPDARPGLKLYTVSAQETLYGISRAFGITVDELVGLNPALSNGLQTGQVIYVPDRQPVVQKPAEQPRSRKDGYLEHRVERKETLYSISRRYGVEMTAILNANPGLGGSLRKNEIILIPLPGSSLAGTVKVKQDSVVLGRAVHAEALPELPAMNCTPSHPVKRTFNLALMVPFSLEKADSVYTGDPMSLKLPSDYRSLDFIQFYEGALIAVDDLAARGMDVRLHVYDADAGEGMTKTRRILNNPEMENMDLIIGPLFARSFELVASFAAKHEIPLINPLSQRSEIIAGNSYVVKPQPSGWSSYNGTAQVLAGRFSDANFVVMRRNDTENASMAGAFSGTLRKLIADPAGVKEVIYSQVHDAGLMQSMVPGKTNVVLMLTNDKALIPALLRRLNDLREKYQIVVVGLPEWEEMEMDINYLHQLNAHFFTPWFVDYSDPEVVRFISSFRDRYIGEPELARYAYLGYDLTAYFLEALYSFGPGFLNCIPDFTKKGLSNNFRFQQQNGGGYENTSITVYRLADFRKETVK